ncbi:DJ-1/PfpI family protein, partial [Nocardiopsis chromatogenes]|uniref:DJ-1/PfpI family protein n=1 Tax=Nocardiopsis chromatogenes TaxID=280239 RepID=UPI00047733F3
MSERTVVVALFEGVQSLDVAGPMEVFACADLYSRAAGGGPAYRIVQASADGATVRCSSGMGLAPQAALEDVGPIDTLVVPGGVGTLRPDERLVGWLADGAASARRGGSGG